MSDNKHEWLNKRSRRSVDALKLWNENPRLSQEEEYVTIQDFVEEIIVVNKEKDAFLDLIRSIATNGFVPADPIVVWQNESNKRYYVAEGNRRVLALKLLRKPSLAPKSIRSTVLKYSKLIGKSANAKIPVAVAPSFEDAEWYISQRNNISSLQRTWNREQQIRWVTRLYEKYDGDVDVIQSKIDLSESELHHFIRMLKIKSMILEDSELFDESEYNVLNSTRFPISTLERFLGYKDVREHIGLEYDGVEIGLSSTRSSFIDFLAEVVKRMVLPKGDPRKIDSRSINSAADAVELISTLPEIHDSFEEESDPDQTAQEAGDPDIDGTDDQDTPSPDQDPPIPFDSKDRTRLIHSSFELITDFSRLESMFNELKEMPFRYKNCMAASIRVFLDLSVTSYLRSQSLVEELREKERRNGRFINLRSKLEFLKTNIDNREANRVINRLLNENDPFSLEVLNGYQHGTHVHDITKTHLNNFWVFLIPLLMKLVDLRRDV